MHFFPAHVAAVRDETKLLHSVVLEVPQEVATSHHAAGQYLRIRLPDAVAEGPYALANPPGEPVELLVKRSEGLANQLVALQPGDSVLLSEARGHGFPLGDAHGKGILLFATGSGIAPIRAAWRRLLQDHPPRTLHLFLGVRTEADLPYRSELDDLERAGAQVHRVISSGEGGAWVQERFRAALPDVSEAVALLCGLPEMVSQTREALLEAGMPPARVHHI